LAGKRIDYKRVSTLAQNTERQLDGMTFDKIFEDKVSGKDVNRPALKSLLEYVREDDVVIVHSLDRFSRNLMDLRQTVQILINKGVSIQFLKENLLFTPQKSDPMSTLLLSVMGAFAEFERALIRERQKEGIEIARRNKVYKGRKPSLNTEQIVSLRERAIRGESKTELAKEFRISRETLYKYLRQKETPALAV
jgi:DNA invertase Pin-like site-specific DNA recombinase